MIIQVYQSSRMLMMLMMFKFSPQEIVRASITEQESCSMSGTEQESYELSGTKTCSMSGTEQESFEIFWNGDMKDVWHGA